MTEESQLPLEAISDSIQNDHQRPQSGRRRPVPRRGHKKSRAGCATCKGRKVKCDETMPECGPCQRLGLDCRYPDRRVSPAMRAVSATPSSSTSRPAHGPLGPALGTEPSSFSNDDLRFFQHFLFTAYPSLPVGGWETWQHVGRMSHSYDFLVHAMLGLGASHLNLVSEADYSKEALNHRVKAIHTLNEHLEQGNMSIDDADAAFAAMLSLMFQSAYMLDGMTDFLSLVRGCFIIGNTLIPDMQVSAFKLFSRIPYIAKVNELLSIRGPVSYINSSIVQGFQSSLERLAPLCQTVPELEYLKMMQSIAATAASNPIEGFLEHSYVYDTLAILEPLEFASMLDPSNHVSRLVIVHLLAIDLVMSAKEAEAVGAPGTSERSLHEPKSTTLVWIETVWQELPDKYKPYADWPRNLAMALTFSFGTAGNTWQPFMLHDGTAHLSDQISWESHGSYAPTSKLETMRV